jgi:hypothetical protein
MTKGELDALTQVVAILRQRGLSGEQIVSSFEANALSLIVDEIALAEQREERELSAAEIEKIHETYSSALAEMRDALKQGKQWRAEDTEA